MITDPPPAAFECAEVYQRLNDYLDRELSTEEIALVEAHLARCVECASEYAFEAGVLRELKARVRRIAMPPSLREKVQNLLASISDEE